MSKLLDLVATRVLLIKKNGVGFYTMGCVTHWNHQEMVLLGNAVDAKTGILLVKELNKVIAQNGVSRVLGESLNVNVGDGTVLNVVLHNTGIKPTFDMLPEIPTGYDELTEINQPLLQIEVKSLTAVHGAAMFDEFIKFKGDEFIFTI